MPQRMIQLLRFAEQKLDDQDLRVTFGLLQSFRFEKERAISRASIASSFCSS